MLSCCFPLRHFPQTIRIRCSSMASTSSSSSMALFDKVLWPPKEVRGMVEFDRSKFRKTVELPCTTIPTSVVNRIASLKSVREYMLGRMLRIKAFRDIAESPDKKLLLFDPDKFAAASSAQRGDVCEQIAHQMDGQQPPEFGKFTYQMEYEDWDLKRCIRAVLPDDLDVGGFEQCGHIIHLNLRGRILPFRFVIGQILLDKVGRARTVVNKLNMLTNEFRTMDMELVAGEADYQTEVAENGIRYRLDYSKVFWNSRLSTVHSETVAKFDCNSVVFDVFSGIGPFVLPALKGKGALRMAFANDLNPSAIEYLRQSMRLNKIPEDRVECSVLDGAEFIRRVIPEKVAHFLAEEEEGKEKEDSPSSLLNFHAVMNLPGHSADFLPHFRGIFSQFPQLRPSLTKCPFWVHCHFFVKASDYLPLSWYEAEARRIVRAKMAIPELEIQELNLNRSVSSRKEMFCARFLLPMDFAFAVKEEEEQEKSLMEENGGHGQEGEEEEGGARKKPRLAY